MSRTIKWDQYTFDFYTDIATGKLVIIEGQEKMKQDLVFALTTQKEEDRDWGLELPTGSIYSSVPEVERSIYDAVDYLTRLQSDDPYTTDDEAIDTYELIDVSVQGTDVSYTLSVTTVEGKEVSVSKGK